MNYKKFIPVSQISLLVILLSSCTTEKKKEIWPPPKSQNIRFELISKDTFNKDLYGYKQGKWYVMDSAKLRLGERIIIDTLYYRNDTIIK